MEASVYLFTHTPQNGSRKGGVPHCQVPAVLVEVAVGLVAPAALPRQSRYRPRGPAACQSRRLGFLVPIQGRPRHLVGSLAQAPVRAPLAAIPQQAFHLWGKMASHRRLPLSRLAVQGWNRGN